MSSPNRQAHGKLQPQTQHPPTARARHVTLVNIDLHVLHDPYNTHKFGGETPRATSLPTHYLLDTTTFMDR